MWIFYCFFGLIVCAMLLAIGQSIMQIVNYYRAVARFSPSIQTRERIEHLIATCNDETNSTLLESRTLIEDDALACRLPTSLRNALVAGLVQQSISGRIRYTRRMLVESYLPKSTA